MFCNIQWPFPPFVPFVVSFHLKSSPFSVFIIVDTKFLVSCKHFCQCLLVHLGSITYSTPLRDAQWLKEYQQGISTICRQFSNGELMNTKVFRKVFSFLLHLLFPAAPSGAAAGLTCLIGHTFLCPSWSNPPKDVKWTC